MGHKNAPILGFSIAEKRSVYFNRELNLDRSIAYADIQLLGLLLRTAAGSRLSRLSRLLDMIDSEAFSVLPRIYITSGDLDLFVFTRQKLLSRKEIQQADRLIP